MLNKDTMEDDEKAKYEQIEKLDLTYLAGEVAEALLPSLGRAAADTQAKADEDCYRDFLFVTWYLLEKGASKVAAPCSCADAMWHQHILVTPKYREDCDSIFGGYLDHIPADYHAYSGPKQLTVADQDPVATAYKKFGGAYCPNPRHECIWCER